MNYAGIRSAETVFLSGFEFIYEYSLRDDGYGDDLVIWAVNEPLAGFEFLEITDKYDYNEYETYFVPGDVLFSLDVLPIGHALVIRNFAGRGIFPNLAISFIDTNGLRRYAGFMHDLSENEKYLFIEFALDNGVPPFALPPWNWDRE
ncbi:MAG: hypothetical protein FWD28_01000 [Treponema sp.]|nr:hypothetical protein [Treponema sp.]